MKSIKKNLSYSILLNLSSVLFPLITAPYVARVLEPDGVGLVNFSGTYAGYFALMAMLGIPTYGVREVSKLRDNKEKLSLLVSQLMSIAVIMTILVSFIYILSIAFVGQLSENFLVFFICGFGLYLAPLNVNWLFEGMEEFGFITFRSLVIRLLSIFFLFLFVKGKDDLIMMVSLNVLCGLIINAWNYVKMKNMGIRPRFVVSGLVPHLKPMSYLFGSVIAVSVYTVLDTVMLGFICEYSEVGYYNNAAHIAKTITSVVTSLSIVAVPRISFYFDKQDYAKISELINKSFSFVSFISFPIVIGIICISSTFIPLFYGDKFYGAIIPLQIMSLVIVFIGYNNLVGMQILVGMRLDKYFLCSIISGAAINFMLNLLLIPYWGAIGASVASVIAEISVLAVAVYYSYNNTFLHLKVGNSIIKSFVGGIMLIPLLILLRSFLSGWILVFLYVLFGAVLYLFFEVLIRNSSAELLSTTIRGVFVNYRNRNGEI